MKRLSLIFLLCSFTSFLNAQTIFHTEDIRNFYIAFDSIQTSNDYTKQQYFVQTLYLDKASFGLTYAINTSLENEKKATATDWLAMMLKAKDNFVQIRPYFNNLESQKKLLETKFAYFKSIYPEFKEGEVFLTMGLGMFGGRISGNNLIIGCELVAKETPDWAVSIVLHEYVHTMQHIYNDALLAHSIMEGTADFVAEVVNQKSLVSTYPNGYIDFGFKHDQQVWNEYKKYIGSIQNGKFFNWIYGSTGVEIDGVKMKDLGYYLGYRFCKAYYEKAIDKKAALKELIQNDLSSNEKAKAFLLKSGYVPKKDLKFIQNLRFEPLSLRNKNLKMRVYGYTLTTKDVVFTFDLPSFIDQNTVNFITVAGSFNGWNPTNTAYQLVLTKDRTYQLRIPKNAFGKEKKHEFKFVINGDSWQSPPEDALNIASGDSNLTLTLP